MSMAVVCLFQRKGSTAIWADNSQNKCLISGWSARIMGPACGEEFEPKRSIYNANVHLQYTEGCSIGGACDGTGQKPDAPSLMRQDTHQIGYLGLRKESPLVCMYTASSLRVDVIRVNDWSGFVKKHGACILRGQNTTGIRFCEGGKEEHLV